MIFSSISVPHIVYIYNTMYYTTAPIYVTYVYDIDKTSWQGAASTTPGSWDPLMSEGGIPQARWMVYFWMVRYRGFHSHRGTLKISKNGWFIWKNHL